MKTHFKRNISACDIAFLFFVVTTLSCGVYVKLGRVKVVDSSIVQAKRVIPGDYTLKPITLDGQTFFMTPDYETESYEVSLTLQGKRIHIPVSKDVFDSVSVGGKVEVQYRSNRWRQVWGPIKIKVLPKD